MPIDDRPQSPQPSAVVQRRGFMLAALVGGLVIAIAVIVIALAQELGTCSEGTSLGADILTNCGYHHLYRGGR
jgi:hypothetical protein